MSTLRSIERFLQRTGMAPTAFGRQAARDPRLVFDLRKGREPSDRMQRRLQHFMAHHEGSDVQ